MGMKVACLEHNSGLQGWPGREKSEVDSTLARSLGFFALRPDDHACIVVLCQMRDWVEVGTGATVS